MPTPAVLAPALSFASPRRWPVPRNAARRVPRRTRRSRPASPAPPQTRSTASHSHTGTTFRPPPSRFDTTVRASGGNDVFRHRIQCNSGSKRCFEPRRASRRMGRGSCASLARRTPCLRRACSVSSAAAPSSRTGPKLPACRARLGTSSPPPSSCAWRAPPSRRPARTRACGAACARPATTTAAPYACAASTTSFREPRSARLRFVRSVWIGRAWIGRATSM